MNSFTPSAYAWRRLCTAGESALKESIAAWRNCSDWKNRSCVTLLMLPGNGGSCACSRSGPVWKSGNPSSSDTVPLGMRRNTSIWNMRSRAWMLPSANAASFCVDA